MSAWLSRLDAVAAQRSTGSAPPVPRRTEYRYWPSPHGPDPVVFGPQYAPAREPVTLGAVLRSCACGVRWAGEPGSACWACKQP